MKIVSTERRRWLYSALVTSLVAAAVTTGGQPADAAVAPALTVHVLSTRADLVSGGQALVAVDGVVGRRVHVTMGSRDVTSAFAVRPDGRFEGVVKGLAVGTNTLTARLDNGSGARIAITNHPIGGPLFAGPQVQPWPCTTTAVGLSAPTDPQCNAPTTVGYYYKSSNPAKLGFTAYNPTQPPTDVAVTTTDRGVTMPFIVRVETGTQDRGIYQVLVLADPTKPWSPWSPQAGWNHKLMVPFGGSCTAHYGQTAPAGAYSSGMFDATALGRGFAVAANGLNTLGNGCNEVVSAEALTMLKEHIRDTLGSIRYTIGEGASGGSIQQYNLAASYPGLLDGITPASAFTDVATTTNEVFDCGLLEHFYESNPLLLTPAQRGFVEGHANVGSSCAAWVALLLPSADPTGNGPLGTGSAVKDNNCGVPAEQRWSSTNTTGVRCDIFDYQAAIYGHRADGYGKRAVTNIGIQYGLAALAAGQITAQQFVDLNAKVGGYDINLNWQPQRMAADPGSIATAYRTGRVTDAHQLANVPIIDIRPQDNEEIHQSYYSYTMRARLDAANGTHANQVLWTVPLASAPLFGAPVPGGVLPPGSAGAVDPPEAVQAFLAMDQWLSRIEADHSTRSPSAKVLADKPAGLVDQCEITPGSWTTDTSTCNLVYPHYANPRISSGAPLANDVMQCQLRTMARSDYSVTFSDAQWATLQKAFPTGVCDWSKPSVGQQAAKTWMSFAGGPGGTPLPAPPTSTPVPAA